MKSQVTEKLIEATLHLGKGEPDLAVAIVKQLEGLELSSADAAAARKILDLAELVTRGNPQIGHKGMAGPPQTPADVRFGYCLLLMENEKEVTIATVANLLQQMDPEDRILILFNGFTDHVLQVHLEKHTGVICFGSPVNLGVAGGRNQLYTHILEHCPAITHIVTLDNDVLLPNDLNARTKQQVVEKYEELRVGVLGAVILDYKKEQIREYINANFLRYKGYLNADCHNIFSEDIAAYLKENRRQLQSVLWHIGMHPDYRSVYVNRTDSPASAEPDENFKGHLAHADKVHEILKMSYFPVSNVPGCFQVFSVDHLRKVGLLEERFSPYFFEDTEFCIRSIRHGRQNIISTELFLLHGTDLRHHERLHESRRYFHLVNEYRARYVLLRSLKEPDALRILMDQAQRLSAELEDEEVKKLKHAAMLEGLARGASQYFDDTAGSDLKRIRSEQIRVGPGSVHEFAANGRGSAPDEIQPRFDASLPDRDAVLPRTYFSRLKKFRDAYSGQDCLIVCNGPSLKNTPLGLFAGMPAFAVNSTFILQDMLGFEPAFYTVEDNHVVADNLEGIRKLKAEAKFFPEKYRPLLGDEEDQYFLPANWDCYFKSKISYEYPEFSTDIARTVFTGQTVTYLNLQLAYYFGFKRVFLVGLDFSYSIPKGARIEQNSIDHDDDDPNHFHPTYFGKGKQWHFPKLDSCMSSYTIANEKFAREGREIIDLTIGGKLNVFRKMEIREALGFDCQVPRIAAGLDPAQYIMDVCQALAARRGLALQYSASSEPARDASGPCVSLVKHRDSNGLLSNLAAIWQRSLEGTKAVLFVNEGLEIAGADIQLLNGLPNCGWINSALSFMCLDIEDWKDGRLTEVPVFEHLSRFKQNLDLNKMIAMRSKIIFIDHGCLYYQVANPPEA